MKHALIISHPNGRSFTASVAGLYGAEVQAMGHTIVERDLYRIGFDPRLQAEEIPSAAGVCVMPDVATERALIRDCDVFAFFYPFWLNAPPAILKGYLDRVFGFGFAYGGEGHSYNPLLKGRKLISFTSSGASTEWVRKTGAMDAVDTLFHRYFAELCGMQVLQHKHFGPIEPGASEFYIRARLEDARATIHSQFATEPV